ncbi:MAG: DNA methyltransferase [Candidatus Acidiferrales bacterium]
MGREAGKYSTAAGRWAGVGPYYAMFPAAFADKVITRYTRLGDSVLDPFAGRGTAVFSAAVHGRLGIGVEINPVGWVYSQAKLLPASEDAVAQRFKEIWTLSQRYRKVATSLPPFFHLCYQSNVLQFLLAARALLNWRNRKADWTAMAFLLVNLHGKRDGALSNQMRQTKSMSPAYAIRWWRERGLKPPELDPLEFMLKRLTWRYAKGVPKSTESRAYLGDSTTVLPQIPRYWGSDHKRARLLLTSPPYFKVTNYHYDQWLRLWLLGGPPTSKRVGGLYKDKFENQERYHTLLLNVFRSAKHLLTQNATVYVRTDRRKLTLRMTADVLREVFPNRPLSYRQRPYKRPTQTKLFGHAEPKLGEVDLVLC